MMRPLRKCRFSRALGLPLSLPLVGAGLLAGPAELTAQPTTPAAPLPISDMAGIGDPAFEALAPAVAFGGSTAFLVVWAGTDDTGGLVAEELEIFGQLVDAYSGAEIGANDFRISAMGGTGDTNFEALFPAVAYNSASHEYLVVWAGRDASGDLLAGELEIYGQRIDAATGAEVGADDFRISQMGAAAAAVAFRPAVAYNDAADEYLVVWEGSTDGGTGGVAADEFEIYGQRIAGSTGAEVGADDFRISDMGGSGLPDFDAVDPAVAYDPLADEYLVVWQGNEDGVMLHPLEQEIYGQRLAGSTGAEVGPNDFRISDMGATGTPALNAFAPAIAFNTDANEYLVVWQGTDLDDSIGMSLVGELEIYGQRIAGSSGAEVGVNDFRISDMGGSGETTYRASEPSLLYSGAEGRYLVLWTGSDDAGGLVAGELEVFGQWLDGSTGAEILANDFRLSAMGGTGDASFGVSDSAAAFGATSGRYYVAWQGDDDLGGLVDEELEIFGQIDSGARFSDGFESGDTSAWSGAVP